MRVVIDFLNWWYLPETALEFTWRDRMAPAFRTCPHFDGYRVATGRKAAGALPRRDHILSLHGAGPDRRLQTLDHCVRFFGDFDPMFLNSETAGRMLGRAVEDDGPVKAMARPSCTTPAVHVTDRPA